MDKDEILNQIQNNLIVSCQALVDEPLHSSFIMSKMALAAKLGGAAAIRANGYDDIKMIKEEVDLPVIGIVKKDYENSKVYITPTFKEVTEVYNAGAEIIAMDATLQGRPMGETLKNLVFKTKKEYPNLILMADISTYSEGILAEKLGFDLVSTTLSGYTPYTKDQNIPNLGLVKVLNENISIPVIAEGGIWTPEQLKLAFLNGAFSAVIGSAITRPMEITKKFVKVLN